MSGGIIIFLVQRIFLVNGGLYQFFRKVVIIDTPSSPPPIIPSSKPHQIHKMPTLSQDVLYEVFGHLHSMGAFQTLIRSSYVSSIWELATRPYRFRKIYIKDISQLHADTHRISRVLKHMLESCSRFLHLIQRDSRQRRSISSCVRHLRIPTPEVTSYRGGVIVRLINELPHLLHLKIFILDSNQGLGYPFRKLDTNVMNTIATRTSLQCLHLHSVILEKHSQLSQLIHQLPHLQHLDLRGTSFRERHSPN